MITMNNKENFLISNMNFINNYDRENFISVSNNALNKENKLPIIDISHFDENFDFLIKTLENIDIKYSKDLIEYFHNVTNIDRRKRRMISTLNFNNNIIIKPNYLLEAANNIRLVLDKIISGEISTNDIYGEYINNDSESSILKQRVISGINNYETPETLFMKKYTDIDKCDILVPVDGDCIKNEIIPFIEKFNDTKNNIKTTIINSSKIIHDTFIIINECISTINNNSSRLENKIFGFILNYLYNHIRNIIETSSIVLYLYISKCYLFEKITKSIIDTSNTLQDDYSDCRDLVESGIFDHRNISDSLSKKISNKLLKGDNNLFEEMVDDIINYHNKYMTFQIYDNDNITFESVINIYDNINFGIDTIEIHVDDPSLIINKLIEESGFNTSLNEQYGYIVEMIDNVNDYYDIESRDTYDSLIGEIVNYTENTQNIATMSNDIMTKISNINDSINNMPDNESKNDLKTLMESVENQFIDLHQNISTNIYNRLRYLAQKADKSINIFNESEYRPEVIIGDNHDDDHRECFLESYINNLSKNNDILMESLLKGYYSEREYLEKGISIIFEDGENNNSNSSSSSSTQPSTNTNTSAKPSVNTNTTGTTVNDQNTSNEQNFEKVKTKIKNLIKKIIDSFKNFMGKNSQKNLQWLKANKEKLINRSYSNVSVNVLPYHVEMGVDNILNHYNTMRTNVNSVVRNIKNITSAKDMRNKLFTFGVTFDESNDEKDILNTSARLTDFFKVGNKPLNTVTYSNKDVKTLVVDTMIPYCERYYGSLVDELNRKGDELLNDTQTAQVNEYAIVTEDENNNTQQSSTSVQTTSNNNNQLAVRTQNNNQLATANQNNNHSSTTNQSQSNDKAADYSKQYEWLEKFIVSFVGSVCNAARARNDDYLKILADLVPKDNNTNNNTQTQQDNKTNNNNQQS